MRDSPNGIFAPCAWCSLGTCQDGCVVPAPPPPSASFWKFRLTFWPRFYNSQFAWWVRDQIKHIWNLEPPPSTEFRCDSHGHSGLAWGAIFEFKKRCSETHSKTPIFHKIHVLFSRTCFCWGFLPSVGRARVPGPAPGPGPGLGPQPGYFFLDRVSFLRQEVFFWQELCF